MKNSVKLFFFFILCMPPLVVDAQMVPPEFKNRFEVPPPHGPSPGPPIEEAKDCGCAPEQEFQTYGFYRPLTGNDFKKKVNFGVLSRIGYYSLQPDEVGNLDVPRSWEEEGEKFSASAHRYGSKVDLTVSNTIWGPTSSGGLKLDKSYVLLNLIDEIIEKIQKLDCDGVTIDFRGIPNSDPKKPDQDGIIESYQFFIKRLKKN